MIAVRLPEGRGRVKRNPARLQITQGHVLFQYLTRRTILFDYKTRGRGAGGREP